MSSVKKFNSWAIKPKRIPSVHSIQDVVKKRHHAEQYAYAICFGGPDTPGAPGCSGGCGSGPFSDD